MTPQLSAFDHNDDADAVFDATGIAARAKRAGDLAPDATLPDGAGRPVRLSDVWRKGPLVLVFYRGGWCGYCNLQLRAWHQRADDLARLGATLLAISPQTPDRSMRTAEDNQFTFTVLSDSNLDAANGFELAFTLPPELVSFYGSVGTDIPVLNGNGLWVLPVPATYVIDEEGRIRFAHIEEDIRKRAEPGDVLRVIEDLVHDRARVAATAG